MADLDIEFLNRIRDEDKELWSLLLDLAKLHKEDAEKAKLVTECICNFIRNVQIKEKEAERIAKNLVDTLDVSFISKKTGVDVTKVEQFRQEYEKNLYK